jgi:yecA family protein
MNITPPKTINKEQIKKLNDFLIGLDDRNKNMNVNQANGLFTAILSAPSLAMPSMYNQIILGSNPEFESEQQAALILSFIMGLRNSVATELNKKIFKLMLWENEKLIPYQEASLNSIAEWCQGYCTGAETDPVWSESNEAIAFLLPFSILADQFGNILEDYDLNLVGDSDFSSPDYQKEQFRFQLPTFIKNFYKYWEKERKMSIPVCGKDEVLFWLEPKTLPNDLCPCGSNKKFIDCCKMKLFH